MSFHPTRRRQGRRRCRRRPSPPASPRPGDRAESRGRRLHARLQGRARGRRAGVTVGRRCLHAHLQSVSAPPRSVHAALNYARRHQPSNRRRTPDLNSTCNHCHRRLTSLNRGRRTAPLFKLKGHDDELCSSHCTLQKNIYW